MPILLYLFMLQYGKKEFKITTGEPIKHVKEVERLLTAIYCPKEVAVMHCKGHSRDGSSQRSSEKSSTLQNSFTADAFDLDRSCGTGKTTVY